MNAARFRSLHGYGAIASLAALGVATVAIVVPNVDDGVGVLLGLFGSLGSFYFVGAYLTHTTSYRVVGEELLRGVVWYGGSLLGWSLVLDRTSLVAATPATLVGLPGLTAGSVCLALIAIRWSTGRALIVGSDRGFVLATIAGTVLGGVLVLYLVVADGESPWLLPAYALAALAGIVVAKRRRRHRETAS